MRRAARTAPLGDDFICCSSWSRRWKCGNRLFRFPRFVGRAENSTIVFRAFHKPSFPRSACTVSECLRRPFDLLEHGAFGLLHSSCGFGVADGRGHAFERMDAESGTQELLWPIQREQCFQRRASQLIEAPFAALGVDLASAWAAGRW